MLNVYFDETADGIGKNIAYGALITTKEISSIVIEEAYISFKNDPDTLTNKYSHDKTTLRNRYFHASEDSPSAHSHICSSINKCLKGEFITHFIHDVKNQKQLMNSLILTFVEIFKYREELKFIFEERQNLTLDFIKNIIDGCYQRALSFAYEIPQIGHSFPRFEYEIASKCSKGLQICDFLLWASLRNTAYNENTWFNRLKPNFNNYYYPIDKRYFGYTLSFSNIFYSKLPVFYPYNYNPKSDKITEKDLRDIVYIVEKKVITIKLYELPKHILDLRKDIELLYESRYSDNSCERFYKLATVFIKLFDSMPLYNDKTDNEEMILLLKSKYIMGLLLQKHLMNSISLLQHLLKIREYYNKEKIYDFY